MLKFYREFLRAYMNDIIIFNKTLKNHVKHFSQIFNLFRVKRVNLILEKFFLSYSFITLLRQKIDNLNLFISTKKIATITSLQFPHSLRDLKYFLSFID